VDVILTPDGLSSESLARLEGASEVMLSRSETRSARFLAFNHTNPYLADPILHQALACVLDPQVILDRLGDDASPLVGFVLGEAWANAEASLPCAGMTGDKRLEEAVRLLKTEGYSWGQEPAPDTPGKGLTTPDGALLPHFSLLAPTYAVDTLRAETADYIAQGAGELGLSVDVGLSDEDELLYAVYGSGEYDMALLGWRLSVYPSYLCEWFTPSGTNPFSYIGSKLEAECEAWQGVSNWEQAKAHVSEIQSILMQDLPLIPLYTGVRVDAYRNVRYPFGEVLDGLSGLYGAPGLAIPNP
jgi:ABC-type transport system substrate-binding protein